MIKDEPRICYLRSFHFLEKAIVVDAFLECWRICATVVQITEKMVKQYLEDHWEPYLNDNFRTAPIKMRRWVAAYSDFQVVNQTHRLLDGGC